MTIEQRAQLLRNTAVIDNLEKAAMAAGFENWASANQSATPSCVTSIHSHRETLNKLDALRADFKDFIAWHDKRGDELDETQAAFDAYRREVSEAIRNLPNRSAALDRFIISDPVDPLTATLDELGVDRDVFDAALAKIGGRIVFGEGA